MENNFVFLFIDVCGEFNIFLHFFELLSYSCTLLLNLIFLSRIAEIYQYAAVIVDTDLARK